MVELVDMFDESMLAGCETVNMILQSAVSNKTCTVHLTQIFQLQYRTVHLTQIFELQLPQAAIEVMSGMKRRYRSEDAVQWIEQMQRQCQGNVFQLGIGGSVVPTYVDTLSPDEKRRVKRVLNEETWDQPTITLCNEYVERGDASICSPERDKELVNMKNEEHSQWKVRVTNCTCMQHFVEFVLKVKSHRMQWCAHYYDACKLLEETQLELSRENNDENKSVIRFLIEEMTTTISLLWNIVSLHRLDASLHQFRRTRNAYANPNPDDNPDDNPDGERKVDPLLFVYKEYGLKYRGKLRSQLKDLQEAILLSRETLDESLFLPPGEDDSSEAKAAKGAAAEDTNKEGKGGIMWRWIKRLDSIESNRTKFPLKFFEHKLK